MTALRSIIIFAAVALSILTLGAVILPAGSAKDVDKAGTRFVGKLVVVSHTLQDKVMFAYLEKPRLERLGNRSFISGTNVSLNEDRKAQALWIPLEKILKIYELDDAAHAKKLFGESKE